VATYPDQAIFGFKLLGSVDAIVDEPESGGFSASEVCAELEHDDAVGFLHVVHLGQFVLQLRLHIQDQNQTVSEITRSLLEPCMIGI
jgi:hypothetical protein